MIKFRLKIFAILEKFFAEQSASKAPDKNVGDVIIEGIKLYEFWTSFEENNKCGVNTPHWLNHMADRVFRIGEILDFRFQRFFAPLDEPTNLTSAVTKFYKDMRGDVGEILIQKKKNIIETVKKRGEPKYDEQLKLQGGFTMTNKEYIHFFKYIALSLSGQFNGDPHANYHLIETTKVDYNRMGPRFTNYLALQKKLGDLYVDFLGPNDFIS